VSYRDLAAGGLRQAQAAALSQSKGGGVALLAASLEVGPAQRGRRAVTLDARLASGGTASLMAEVFLTPGDELLDHAYATLLVNSLALGPLAEGLDPSRPVPRELARAALSGNLAIEAQAERLLRGAGELQISGLPKVPQLGFRGPDDLLIVKLSGELSTFKPHFDLEVSTHRNGALALRASLRQRVADGTEPSFHMDNYVLDVAGSAHADFSCGGLPGTPLAAGKGSLCLSLKGTMAEAKASLKATLDGGAVALDGATEPVPPVTIELDGTFSLARLTAELSRLALLTEGVRLAASGAVRPRGGADDLRIASDGSLPPMKGEATLDAALDFARWPPGLRVLAGLPHDRPATGTFTAKGKASLDGECRYELTLDLDRVPLDQGIPGATRLPFLGIVNAVAGGRPEAMDFVASLKAGFSANGVTREAVRGSFAGKGELTLRRLRMANSPLFSLLADWGRHPELRDVAFERVDAPFALAAGRLEATATVPHGGGALIFRGHSTTADGLRYTMHVRDPRQVAFIPKDAVEYLEAGLPLIHISGPPDAPAARIAVEAIRQFNLRPGR